MKFKKNNQLIGNYPSFSKENNYLLTSSDKYINIIDIHTYQYNGHK